MDYRILGPLEVIDEGRPIPLGRAKQRALLAILLLHPNEPVSIDRLIDDLWGEEAPTTAENTLQVYVSQLRKLLGSEDRKGSQVLMTRPPGYALNLGPDELDTDRFTRLAAQGHETLTDGDPDTAIETLGEALALWRGETLADFTYEAFAQPEIERLKELRLLATEDLIDARLALGHHQELVGELESLVRAEPLRERLRELQMLALYRCGRQADALGAYRGAADTLREQLGIDPGPGLQRLHERILRQDPLLEAPRPAHVRLPTPPSPLIGRGDEVSDLSDLLASGARIITVTGPGGVGKTRVAIESSQRLDEVFTDAVVFVDLAPLRDADLVALAVSAALRLHEAGSAEPEQRLVGFLRDRRILLVLDNFEHLMDAAPLVGRLAAATQAPSFLITSRVALRVSGEQRFPLAPLPMPVASADAGPDDRGNDAVRLFEQRARAADPDFRLDATNTQAVTEICRRLDGLPLAIELASARVTMLPPSSILERLEHRLAVLADGPRDADDRQRSLRATVDWSYRLLEEDERTLFTDLSVFAGGWSLEAAAEVCALPSQDDALRVLGALRDDSLVSRIPSVEGPRFGMLETIREVASELLDGSGRAEEVRRRHAWHYLQLAEESERGLHAGSQRGWIDRVRQDLGNLRAALDWLLRSREIESAARLAGGLGQFWCTSGQLAEGRRWVEEALQASESASPVIVGKLLDARGRILYRQSEWDLSEATHERALALAREVDDAAGTAAALNGIGLVAFARGEEERAEGVFEEALRLGRSLHDDWRIQSELVGLAGVHYTRGRLADATALLEESLAISQARGDDDGAAAELSNLAEIALAQSEFAKATTYAEQAVEILRKLGELPHLANAQLKLGLAMLMSASTSGAAQILEESIRIAMELGDMWVGAEAVEAVALLSSRNDHRDDAVRLYGAAHAMKERLGLSMKPALELEYEEDLAELRASLGDAFDDAWSQGSEISAEDAFRFALDELDTEVSADASSDPH